MSNPFLCSFSLLHISALITVSVNRSLNPIHIAHALIISETVRSFINCYPSVFVCAQVCAKGFFYTLLTLSLTAFLCILWSPGDEYTIGLQSLCLEKCPMTKCCHRVSFLMLPPEREAQLLLPHVRETEMPQPAA